MEPQPAGKEQMQDVDRFFDAITRGDASAARSALAADPNLVNARNAAGVSAVLTTLYHRKKDVLDLLLEANPSLDGFDASALGRTDQLRRILATVPGLATAWSGDGFTALHLACFFGHLSAARLLLDGGADADAVSRNPMKVRPLHSAAAAGQTAIVALLLDRGADVNAQQEGGWTALHAAAHAGHLEMAEILIRRGAGPEIKSSDGRTAADMAREKADSRILQLLRR
jgi:uncharacterized protein